jgi:hypothetical protein
VVGASEVGERRITGVSWTTPGRAVSAPGRPKPGVGQDIESWCGPCGEMMNPSIVAMIGDLPRQVVCQTCGGRHGFRSTPARKPAAANVPEVIGFRGTQNAERAEKKAEELRALAREVAEAAEVRPFDAKARYKPGEFIDHPQFGRGKVETVLRSSLLVRFANGGMKSLMLT